MRVFVESLSGEIISDYCFKGYIAAVNAGHDVQKVSLTHVSLMDRESLKDVLPIGSTEYMIWFMTHVHEIPVPEPLKAHRLAPNFYTLKWKEVDKLADVEFPCFIKPLNDIKKFTGFVPCPMRSWRGHGFPTCQKGKLRFNKEDLKNRNKLKP